MIAGIRFSAERVWGSFQHEHLDSRGEYVVPEGFARIREIHVFQVRTFRKGVVTDGFHPVRNPDEARADSAERIAFNGFQIRRQDEVRIVVRQRIIAEGTIIHCFNGGRQRDVVQIIMTATCILHGVEEVPGPGFSA